MPAGTTYPVTIRRLGRFLVGFRRIWLANAAREYMVRVKNASRFEACGWVPAMGSAISRQLLSPVPEMPARMQEELHVICRFPVQIRVVRFGVR